MVKNMKGLRLKDGKDNLKNYLTGYHQTFDEWMKSDFVVQFYHKELDFHYETEFNWSKPFDYITKHLKDLFIYKQIGINTIGGMIENNYEEYMKDGEVSHKGNWGMYIISHCWLKVQGHTIMKSIYNELGSKPSKEVFEKSDDLVDIPLHIIKDEDGRYTMRSPLMYDFDDNENELLEEIPKDEMTLIKNKGHNVFSTSGSSSEELSETMEEISLMEQVKKYEPSIKVGRNQSCPCGSGIKFKKCCFN
jgi:hypothetical protein